jgi:hypothetical protein
MIKLCKETFRNKNETQKEKCCQFPRCKEKFIGRGKSKYCEEHRKDKYKKELYKQEKKKLGDNSYIKHDNEECLIIIKKCGLKGCVNEFDIKLIPNQYIYPKYCEEHRNKFKRDNYIKRIDDEKN